ncbi:MAG: radical SAM protein [Armatimonadota bacterium]|nr:radical SAM protein [bacterium]
MNQLRLVFWETTTACNLKCIHCRACATEQRPPDELSFDQSAMLLRDIAQFAKPVVILSGGEPTVRDDIFDIASLGTDLGLRMVLATNATTLTSQYALKLAQSGIQRISVSIDGADNDSHDAFRGVPGAFEGAVNGIEHIKSAGIPFQVNVSVTRASIADLPRILDMSMSLGACAMHLFLLVPTGCGKEIADTEMISPEQYENVLNWLYDASLTSPISLKATCAPHYFRVSRQRGGVKTPDNAPKSHLEAVSKGCLAGSAVCFVSARGDVYPCGYFPLSAGNILDTPFQKIWEESELFTKLRNPSLLTGKCGGCEFKNICGGCRARAYAETGDYLSEEPYCTYSPNKAQNARTV